MARNKLELTWVGKDDRPRLEPRVLIEDQALSHRAEPGVGGDAPIYDNRLIFGDNLLALKALEQEFAGKVKCIYIDPPFNTGQAFAQYDDGVEHSIWLSLMRDRIELLRALLSPDGVLWVHCDDAEQAYCKVVLDEVFGRQNFVTAFIWRKVDSPNDNKVPITPDHEYLLCYERNAGVAGFRQKSDASLLEAFRHRAADGRLYRDRLLKKNGKNSLRSDRPSMFFAIQDPDGNDVYPIHDDEREARWSLGEQSVRRMLAAGELIWKDRGRGGLRRWVPYTREYAAAEPTRPWPTIWHDLPTTRQAKAHQRDLLPGVAAFDTPKPEQLIERVLQVCSSPGDIVLDSFAGSGTAGAVAHKMGRRWIMIELGEHAHTHIIPRMRKVIDGEDAGGITEAVNWQGGGGFRYFRLAPSLLEKDSWGNWVINPTYNSAMLAEAICKLEGFTYAPSAETFWQHGESTERDFIYVTTQTLTHDQLAELSALVGADRSLLICCGSFKRSRQFPNLTVKKIPAAVLDKCEFGRGDYALDARRNGEDPATTDAESNADSDIVEEPTTA